MKSNILKYVFCFIASILYYVESSSQTFVTNEVLDSHLQGKDEEREERDLMTEHPNKLTY